MLPKMGSPLYTASVGKVACQSTKSVPLYVERYHGLQQLQLLDLDRKLRFSCLWEFFNWFYFLGDAEFRLGLWW